MTATWDSNISLCTGVLGMFMVVPLIALARKRPASFWLGLYLFTIASASLGDYYLWNSDQRYAMIAMWPNACVATFYYCYVRSIVGLGNSWRQARHFLLPAAYVLGMLAWLGLRGPNAQLLRHIMCSQGMLFVCQQVSAVYLVAVLLRLKQHRARVLENYSSTKDRDLRWLTALSYTLATLWLVWVLATIFGGDFLAVFLAARLGTFYFVGWYGMRQSAVFVPAPASAAPSAIVAVPTNNTVAAPASEPVASHPMALAASAAGAGAVWTPEPAAHPALPEIAQLPITAEPGKYARSGMTDAAQQLIGERLARRMSQERDYLESDLRLTDLADRIGTTPQLLSQYLNHVLGLSFFDYINGLRITEVQAMMRDPAHADTTLLELAHAAGFNSKSTFNTYFKNICGMAPSSWRMQYSRQAA